MSRPLDLGALLADERIRARLGARGGGLQAVRLLKDALPGGCSIYELQAGGCRAVLRVAADDEAAAALRREGRIVRGLAGRVAVEVPDTTFFPGAEATPPLALHTLVEGQPLTTEMLTGMTERARQRLVDDLVSFMLCVHSVELPLACRWSGIQAGDLARSDFQVLHGKPGWFDRELVVGARQGIAQRLDVDLLELLDLTLAEFEDLPVGSTDLGLVHGDLHGYNLAMRQDAVGWHLAGVFDFGISGVRDPNEDIFRLNFVSRELAREVVAAYDSRAGGARQLVPHRIDVYYRAFLYYLMIEQWAAADAGGFDLYAGLLRGYLAPSET